MPRDPNRLGTFYVNLAIKHTTYFPDWRFGQFMSNFLDYLQEEGTDIFYLEEDDMEKAVDRFIEHLHPMYKKDHRKLTKEPEK